MLRSNFRVVAWALTLALALTLGLDSASAAKKKRKKHRRKPKATVTKVEPAPAPPVETTAPAATTEPAPDKSASPTAAPEAELPAAETPAVETPASPAPEAAADPAGPETMPAGVEVINAAGPGMAPAEAAPAADAPVAEVGAEVMPAPLGKSWRVGAHAGAAVPGVVSKLSFGAQGGLDVGYLLPVLDRRVEVYGRFDYLRPSYRADATDPRLVTSTTYSYKVIEEELVVGFGAAARLWQPGAYLNVYGRLGGEVRMQRSIARGRATTSLFGENQETKTAAGLLLGGGGELLLGPGVAFAELDLSYADLSHDITGDTSTGGLGLLVGYAVLF